MFIKAGLPVLQALLPHLQLDLKYTGTAITIGEGIVVQTFAVAMQSEEKQEYLQLLHGLRDKINLKSNLNIRIVLCVLIYSYS